MHGIIHTGRTQSHKAAVEFDEAGNLVVNHDCQQSRKLIARRVIEARHERRSLERSLDEYDFSDI